MPRKKASSSPRKTKKKTGCARVSKPRGGFALSCWDRGVRALSSAFQDRDRGFFEELDRFNRGDGKDDPYYWSGALCALENFALNLPASSSKLTQDQLRFWGVDPAALRRSFDDYSAPCRVLLTTDDRARLARVGVVQIYVPGEEWPAATPQFVLAEMFGKAENRGKTLEGIADSKQRSDSPILIRGEGKPADEPEQPNLQLLPPTQSANRAVIGLVVGDIRSNGVYEPADALDKVVVLPRRSTIHDPYLLENLEKADGEIQVWRERLKPEAWFIDRTDRNGWRSLYPVTPGHTRYHLPVMPMVVLQTLLMYLCDEPVAA